MEDTYVDIKKHCDENSRLIRAVLDDFLIPYAAAIEKLVPLMERQIKKYNRTTQDWPASYLNYLKSEYIAHRIFSRSGFITRYLNHSEVNNLPQQQDQFLEFYTKHPWRYSFAEILEKKEDALFEMEDVMTGERYLLYSPGMQSTEAEQHPRLWFTLVAYNGKCWQTFGLIIPLKAFTVDDIFFFATEINPQIEDEDMLMEEVERNPFPFFMLLSASNMPVVVSRGYETVQCYSTDVIEDLDVVGLSGLFTKAWSEDVYRLTLNKYGEFPHYAIAFYNERKKELLRTAMTMKGFEELTLALATAGHSLNLEAGIAVSSVMILIAEKILNKRIELNPYENLFKLRVDEEESQNLEQMNRFLQLVLPYYNTGKEIDVKKLAAQAGIDEGQALSIWEHLKKNIGSGRKDK